MSFNAFYSHDAVNSLVRREVIQHDLRKIPLREWTNIELTYRLAHIYPQVDGREHLTASDEVKKEIDSLIKEITDRGLDWTSNLRLNERITGFGWLSGSDYNGLSSHTN